MHRLLLSELIKWKNNKERKPLILKGIRQCGKTYLLKIFGENIILILLISILKEILLSRKDLKEILIAVEL